jgi:hypothetical protein
MRGNIMTTPHREVTNYNALLPVADAASHLAKAGGDAAVIPVLEKIVSLGLGDNIGLRLLHKHNDLRHTEHMFEREFSDEEGHALVTAATGQQSQKRVPNSWQLTADGCIAIEYSDPALLCAPDFDVEANAGKLAELYAVLADMKLDHLLGPSVNYDKHVYRGKDISAVAFLEKTDVEHRANVVRMLDHTDPSIANSTKTKWYAQPTVDSNGKTKWLTACNCFCSVSPNGDGHQGTTTHIYSGDGEEAEKSRMRGNFTM